MEYGGRCRPGVLFRLKDCRTLEIESLKIAACFTAYNIGKITKHLHRYRRTHPCTKSFRKHDIIRPQTPPIKKYANSTPLFVPDSRRYRFRCPLLVLQFLLSAITTMTMPTSRTIQRYPFHRRPRLTFAAINVDPSPGRLNDGRLFQDG